jgi:ATP-dependent Zn protease
VDLPDARARRDILALHLARRGCPPEGLDLEGIARATEGFTGAELEQAVVSARYGAAAEDRAVDTAALQAAVDATVPLSVTMAEAFESLRAWAAGRTVPAARVPSA